MTRLPPYLERLDPDYRRARDRSIFAKILASCVVLLALATAGLANCNDASPPPVPAVTPPLTPVELPDEVLFRCCSAVRAPVETGLVAI